MERLDRHRESCRVCRALEQYAKERLPPLPSRPMPPVVRAITWAAHMLDRLPAWARPVPIGAVGTLVFTATRMLLGLPMLIRDPGQVGPMLLTLVAGLGVGAAGGLVYSAVRPTFRRLGPAGNYLTGVVCAVVYLMLLDLVVPAALGSAAAESREEWWRLLVFSVILGLVMGHRSLKSPTRSVHTT